MKNKRIIYCVFGILLFSGITDLALSQEKAKTLERVEAITDKNFKKKIAKGFVLVKFTAAYQYANLDPKLFDGIKGFEGCVILSVENEKTKKVTKKLRLRNFPSIALFHNGSKLKVWKADMDGAVDITTKDIKKAIADAMSGDVF